MRPDHPAARQRLPQVRAWLVSDTLAARLVATFVADLQALEQADPHPAGIGPSDVGNCRRQVAYRVRGVTPDRKEDAGLRRHAWIGTALHAHVAQARSLSHPTWQVEAKQQAPGMERPGTVDAYMDDLRNVDDIKSKSGRGMDAILSRGRAYDSDREQVSIYALAVEHASGVAPLTCSVTYVDRQGYLDPFVDCWTYDRAEALRALAKLHALQDAIDAGEELPRDGRGPDTGRPCDTCRWIKTCWQLDKVPEGYTAQSAYLAPEEVADAADQLRRLRAEKAELDAAIEYLRLQVVGHDGAEFVDSDGIRRRVKWSSGSRRGGALDSKAVRERYAALSEDVPTLGSAPRVTTPAVP